MDLPPLDLARESDPDYNLHQRVYESCCQYGFVKFVGHGIDEGVVSDAFAWARKFFALATTVKHTAERPPGPGPNRGYAAVGKEKLAGISGYSKGKQLSMLAEDVKESFDFGPEHDSVHPTPWPPETDLPGFREFMVAFSGQCDEIHLRILRILQAALGEEQTCLTPLCDRGHGEVRLTHYPPVALARLQNGNTFRIAEHTDTGTLTLLFQDSVGGLELEHPTRDGEFIPVATDSPSEMIVNVGDTLRLWTNGRLRSANHRVVAPKQTQELLDGVIPARFSVGFFGKANPDAKIVCQKEAEGSEGTVMTAAEFYSELQTKTFPTHVLVES